MTRGEPTNVGHRRRVAAALAELEAAVPDAEKPAIKQRRTKNERWLRRQELGLGLARGRAP